MIAVILIVAITVVMSAGAYLWTSSFASNEAPASKTLAMTSGGTIAAPSGNNPQKLYSVAMGTPGLRWSDIALAIDGTEVTYLATLVSAGAPDPNSFCILAATGSCETSLAAAGMVDAGDRLMIEDATLAGSKLVARDIGANSVILTLTVG